MVGETAKFFFNLFMEFKRYVEGIYYLDTSELIFYYNFLSSDFHSLTYFLHLVGMQKIVVPFLSTQLLLSNRQNISYVVPRFSIFNTQE